MISRRAVEENPDRLQELGNLVGKRLGYTGSDRRLQSFNLMGHASGQIGADQLGVSLECSTGCCRCLVNAGEKVKGGIDRSGLPSVKSRLSCGGGLVNDLFHQGQHPEDKGLDRQGGGLGNQFFIVAAADI